MVEAVGEFRRERARSCQCRDCHDVNEKIKKVGGGVTGV